MTTTASEQRALSKAMRLQLAAQVERVRCGIYRVPSTSEVGVTWTVIVESGAYSCTCKASTKPACVHRAAVYLAKVQATGARWSACNRPPGSVSRRPPSSARGMDLFAGAVYSGRQPGETAVRKTLLIACATALGIATSACGGDAQRAASATTFAQPAATPRVAAPTVVPPTTVPPTVPPPPPAATSTAVPAPVAPTPAPQLAILFDAPTWIGKPASDFAAAFGQPIDTSRHNPGAVTSLPNGGLSREYKSGWGSVQCFFASDQPPAPCLAFLLYFDDATAPADFDDALRKTNLPLGRPPDTQRVPSIRTWSNLGGLYVGMTAKNAQAPQVVQMNVRRAG